MSPDNETLEAMKKLTRRRRTGLIAALAGFVCPILPAFLPAGDAWWEGWVTTLCILAAIFLLICGTLVWYGANSRLKDLISAVFVPDALHRAFGSVEYEPERHIPNEFIDADLVPRSWENTGGNDYVRADYQYVPIEFSDIYLTYVTGLGNKKRTRSAFHGLWLICTFEKGFPAELKLVSRKGRMAFGVKTPVDMTPLLSGNEALDKKFLLFSDNPLSAQSILTPQAAEDILRLYDYTKGCCSLKIERSGKVHVAVNSDRNLFEPGKRVEEAERRIDEETRYVTDIIDLLLGAIA